MTNTVTEEEAKEKWCPFSMAVFGNGSSGNRDFSHGCDFNIPGHPIHRETRCLGSACMAWTWSEIVRQDADAGEIQTGYCGLARKS